MKKVYYKEDLDMLKDWKWLDGNWVYEVTGDRSRLFRPSLLSSLRSKVCLNTAKTDIGRLKKKEITVTWLEGLQKMFYYLAQNAKEWDVSHGA